MQSWLSSPRRTQIAPSYNEKRKWLNDELKAFPLYIHRSAFIIIPRTLHCSRDVSLDFAFAGRRAFIVEFLTASER